MPTHKSNDYKLTAVQYYLVEDKTQEEVCKIFNEHNIVVLFGDDENYFETFDTWLNNSL